jgi:DNA-binding NarL/FixJ family response regulator
MISFWERKASVRKARILIIGPSSDVIMQAVIRRKDRPDFVHVADTAEDARAHCALRAYDEIILDVDGVDEFGPTVIKQLRDLNIHKSPLHISTLCTFKFTHLEEQCMIAGADAFLTYADFAVPRFGAEIMTPAMATQTL